jgi:hypothetical protein
MKTASYFDQCWEGRVLPQESSHIPATHSTETESSSPYSHEPAIGPYLSQMNPVCPIDTLYLLISVFILFSRVVFNENIQLCRTYQNLTFSLTCMHTSVSWSTCYVLHGLFPLIEAGVFKYCYPNPRIRHGNSTLKALHYAYFLEYFYLNHV